METHTLEVLDLKNKDGRISCDVDRYQAHLDPEKPLVVSWNAQKCPRGFQSVGGGVAFVEKSPTWTHRRTPQAEPDHLGPGELAWRDTAHHGKMMLIAILPPGYAYDDSYFGYTFGIQPEPGLLPTRFKVFNNRMAFFWELDDDDTDVRWKMRAVQTNELSPLVAELNRRAFNHRRGNPTVSLKDERQQSDQPSRDHGSEGYPPALWEKIIVYVAASLVILFVLILAMRDKPFPDPNIVVMLRTILSLAVAAFGATVPGFLHVGWKRAGFMIRAGGALALFVITFFSTPTVLPSQ